MYCFLVVIIFTPTSFIEFSIDLPKSTFTKIKIIFIFLYVVNRSFLEKVVIQNFSRSFRFYKNLFLYFHALCIWSFLKKILNDFINRVKLENNSHSNSLRSINRIFKYYKKFFNFWKYKNREKRAYTQKKLNAKTEKKKI